MKDKVQVTVVLEIDVPNELSDSELKRCLFYNSDLKVMFPVRGWTRPVKMKVDKVNKIKCISL